MQLQPVVHSQTLLVIILALCRSKKVSNTNLFHADTHTYPVMAHISILSLCSKSRAMQHTRSTPEARCRLGRGPLNSSPLHLNDKHTSMGIYLNANQVLSHTPFSLHGPRQCGMSRYCIQTDKQK